MKYSLFTTETFIYGDLSKQEVIFLKTFDTLDEAKSAQKEFKEKTIILNSW